MTFLTTKQVADRLQVTVEHVCDLIKTGRLRAHNIGVGLKQRTYRITEADFDSFMDAAVIAPSVEETQPRRRRRLA